MYSSGEKHYRWNGGVKKQNNGYLYAKAEIEHPKKDNGGYVLQHILVAEKALGKHLPEKTIVHHVDENKLNNRNNNLVVCEDIAYHLLLHVRMRAFRECGNANFKKCIHCKKYDDPTKLKSSKRKPTQSPIHYHSECAREHNRNYSRTRIRRQKDA